MFELRKKISTGDLGRPTWKLYRPQTILYNPTYLIGWLIEALLRCLTSSQLHTMLFRKWHIFLNNYVSN